MKIFTSIALAVAITCSATSVGAAAIGRSSVSVSRSAPAAPARPSVAPSTPSKPSYIGSNSQAIGVQKPDVTQAAQNKTPVGNTSTHGNSTYRPPSYSSPVTPAYTTPSVPAIASPVTPSVTNGSTFMSSLGGSFVGSALGNVIFGHHGSSGSTVINNNGSGGSSVVPSNISSPSQYTSVPSQPKSSYGMFNFLADLIGFILIIGVVGLCVYGFREVWKYFKEQKKEEVAVKKIKAFAPMTKFWQIQDAFQAADKTKLGVLLGSCMKDEILRDIEPSTSVIKSVSFMYIYDNGLNEISIRYDFEVDGEQAAQVWHFEEENGEWVLNGIENLAV